MKKQDNNLIKYKHRIDCIKIRDKKNLHKEKIELNLCQFQYLKEDNFKTFQNRKYSVFLLLINSPLMKAKQSRFPNEQQTKLYDKITKVETKILDKLTYLKKNKKHVDCKHMQGVTVCQKYDPSVNYYDKFWKTFLINEITSQRIQQLTSYFNEYNKKIDQVEDLLDKHQQLTGMNSKRRLRRPAEEISKQNQCPYPQCFKVYGSEVSLNLHIKLKHNGGNKTDREKAAELIWQAREKGKPVPQFYINLPPGFVENYGIMTERIPKTSNINHQQKH